jgi:GNAT superfamily N-acetyltransferase
MRAHQNGARQRRLAFSSHFPTLRTMARPSMPFASELEFHPLTPDRWEDFVRLFGKNGACAGCWCMWWRLPRAQWVKQKGAGNRRAIRKIVEAGKTPGLLAYADGQPVGWCAIAPRIAYPRLAISRTLKPVDDQPVWSVTCFFIARPYRRCGLSVALLNAAVEFARRGGAKLVEGYPVEPKKEQADAFVYTGLASAFRNAGFQEATRRSPTRPVMRREVLARRASRARKPPG